MPTVRSSWRSWPRTSQSGATGTTAPGKPAPRTVEGDNADAHMKRQTMGREAVMAITDGRPDGFALLTKIFSPWEQILCGEFDGRRRKRVRVKIIGESWQSKRH